MMKLLVLLAVAVAGVPAAHGQDSLPAVKGRVTDASTGADIDFADVVIVDTGNRTVARTIVSGGELDRKSTRLNSSHNRESRMPSSA